MKSEKSIGQSPLRVAIKTWFHSLVELLLRHEQDQEVKNDILSWAVSKQRPDLVEVAVEYGADIRSAPRSRAPGQLPSVESGVPQSRRSFTMVT